MKRKLFYFLLRSNFPLFVRMKYWKMFDEFWEDEDDFNIKRW